MARRRLIVPEVDALARRRAEAVDGARERSIAPVAHVAGDAATAYGQAVERALAQAADYVRADAEGLVLKELPLQAIDLDHLQRDRCAADLESTQALEASIAKHGLRTPIEVVPPADADGRFGLVSGRRRVLALQELFRRTGDQRHAVAKAIVRPALPARDAYVAMVEENEIRADLSFYERGRIAVVVVKQGIFASVGEAVDELFSSASPAKRSKIRSFARIHEVLGDALAYPTAIGERIGLRLADALRRGSPEALRSAVVAAGPFADAAAEQAVLDALVSAPEPTPNAADADPSAVDGTPIRRRGRPRRPLPATTVTEFRSGIRLERRELADRIELRVSGPGLDVEVADRLATTLAELLDGGSTRA